MPVLVCTNEDQYKNENSSENSLDHFSFHQAAVVGSQISNYTREKSILEHKA